jgi:hypothetical protein
MSAPYKYFINELTSIQVKRPLPAKKFKFDGGIHYIVYLRQRTKSNVGICLHCSLPTKFPYIRSKTSLARTFMDRQKESTEVRVIRKWTKILQIATFGEKAHSANSR